MIREFAPGMGQAVAERTILRKLDKGTRQERFETWEDVSHRVAIGNSLLSPDPDERESERLELLKHLLKVNITMSGRHLQHGDEDQPHRTQEVFTNCATSATSFMMFYLLMSGSGVGRCYDDDLMLVDWDYSPNLRCVLDDKHPDFNYVVHESVREARHKYGDNPNVIWHTVGDTREEWAKAVELYERLTFEKVHKEKILVLDFSPVRCKGSEIKGMQGRPASGPCPLMNSFMKVASLKGARMALWMQAMYVDHFFAECVLVGGARRSARMSVKSWRDESIIDFIQIKRPIEFYGKSVEEVAALRKGGYCEAFLWSSNNSVLVDKEFWRLLDIPEIYPAYNSPQACHARKVFEMVTGCAYGDGTGEPGLINQDELIDRRDGMDEALASDDLMGSRKYTLYEQTRGYIEAIVSRVRNKPLVMIVNPCSEIALFLMGGFCVHGDTRILTRDGYAKIADTIGKKVEVFNGKQWSTVTPKQTGTGQKLYRVRFSDGSHLDCTDSHRFSVKKHRQSNKFHVVTTKELWAGAILPTARTPSDIVGESLVDAYTYGAFLGDGSIENRDGSPHKFSIQLYAGKMHLPVSGERGRMVEGKVEYIGMSHLDKCKMISLKEDDGLPEWVFNLDRESATDFVRGWLDTDGTYHTATGGMSIDTSDERKARDLQLLLRRLGMLAASVSQSAEVGDLTNFGPRKRPMYRVYIPASEAGKINGHRVATHYPVNERHLTKQQRVVSVEELPGVHDTFCFTEPQHNMGVFNNVLTHNCVIGDVCPYFADTLDEAEQAFRAMTRALIRVNMMESVYKAEVRRTNRIGVAITGIHEFAWKFFKLNFYDLIDEGRSREFWLTLARFNRAVRDEAEKYCRKHNLPVPHTLTTIKPSGTMSKLWGLTEGWHLPAMSWYLRWVQFHEDDPLVAQYSACGYPTRALKQYKNTIIVGFPTEPLICRIGAEIVLAGEATMDEQYQWLRLGEKYWIKGTDEEGRTLEDDRGNQISYTAKYDPRKVSFDAFKRSLRDNQRTVRCCAVMPQEDGSSYEYLPEDPITQEDFQRLVAVIDEKTSEYFRGRERTAIVEDINQVHLECENGACPVDFNTRK